MAFVVIVWGTNFAVLKLALGFFPPLAFNALRFALGSLAMVALLAWREGLLPLPDRKGWLKLVSLGVIGNCVYQIIFIAGLARTSSAHAGMIVTATPVLVAFFGAILRVERLHRNVLRGLGVAVSGMLLVLSMRGQATDGATLVGDLLLLGSCVCWALYTVGVRTLGTSFSPLRVTALTMVAGTPGLAFAGAPQLLAMDWGMVPLTGWTLLVYATAFPLVIAYLAWNASIRQVGPARTAVYNCAIPVVAVFAAWALFGEEAHLLQLAGAVLVIAGVLLSRTAPKLAGELAVEPQRDARTFSTTSA